MNTTKTPDVEEKETADNEQPTSSKPAEKQPESQKQKESADKKTDSHEKTKSRKKEEEQELSQLHEENEKLKQELTQTKDIYQRMLAEYANYKRRTELEKEQIGDFTKAETLKTLLPAIDNLERAAAAPPGEEYKTGVDMTIRQLVESLKAQGLDYIDPKGEAFDPELHHAVSREDADGVEPDTVTEVFQKGYRLGSRILRPAMVKVAN